MHGKELRLPTVKPYCVKSCSLAAPVVVACICSVVSASAHVNGDIFIRLIDNWHCIQCLTVFNSLFNFYNPWLYCLSSLLTALISVFSSSCFQCLLLFKTSDKPTVLYQPSTKWQTDKAIASSGWVLAAEEPCISLRTWWKAKPS